MVNIGFLAGRNNIECEELDNRLHINNLKFLTFIVPAIGGCNLKCSFCFVRQRREITENCLEVSHYVKFIREVADFERPYALAIQGYEPLLPSALGYTQAILATGRLLKIPTSIVTNGTHLADTVDLLLTVAPSSLAVSLDAGDSVTHDRLRGAEGTWRAAVSGIERAAKKLMPGTNIAVASVLFPSANKILDGMPALLRELGISNWFVTPLQSVGKCAPGGFVGKRGVLYENVLRLHHLAEEAGIQLIIDDELDALGSTCGAAWPAEFRSVRVSTLPKHVMLIRLSPGGECSVQHDVCRRIDESTQRWRPEENGGEFLARILGGGALVT